MSAREFLEKANHYQIKPEELFEYFATSVDYLTVIYQKSATSKKPLLARSNRPGSKYVVAFTDQEATKHVKVHQPESLEMVDEPALTFLLKAYRSNAEGLMFNPGLTSRFFVVRHQLLEWIRYYCMYIFSQQSEAWVIRVGSSIVKGVYQSGFSTVAIYSSEQEATKYAEKLGGIATQQSWMSIFQYLERIKAKTLYVNYGLPEAFLLNQAQVKMINDHITAIEQVKAYHPAPTEVETAVTSEPVAVANEESTGDWQSVFAEEEPLTMAKDVQNTENETFPSQIDDKLPANTQTVRDKEITEVTDSNLPAQNDSVTDEDNKTNTSSVAEKTTSSFDTAWGEEDGFEEINPKPSLVFQSKESVKTQSEQDLNQEPENEQVDEAVNEVVQEQVQEPVQEQKATTVPPAISSIPDGTERGLQLLEKATNDGQGMANGWEVCRALADLRRIWVIVDMEGKMVILASQDESQVADFFTSEHYAKALIDEAHLRNAELPPMVPRLISTRKLFRALAPTGCIIWINRGSAIAWTSIMGDTLPYVLQLMAQKE